MLETVDTPERILREGQVLEEEDLSAQDFIRNGQAEKVNEAPTYSGVIEPQETEETKVVEPKLEQANVQPETEKTVRSKLGPTKSKPVKKKKKTTKKFPRLQPRDEEADIVEGSDEPITKEQ